MYPTRMQLGFLLTPKELSRAESRFGWYEEKRRAESGVHYDQARGCWDLFRYEDVYKLLSDYSRFSSRRGGVFQANNLLNLDPPTHKRYRGLISQAFTSKAIERMIPRMKEITRELIDKAVTSESTDLVRDLAYPLPVIVISELLGVPAEDREKFKRWSDSIVESVDMFGDPGKTGAQLYRKQQALSELGEYLARVIMERKAEPRSDLISTLVEAKLDDARLNMPELLGFSMLLLVAGNETTTNWIGNALCTFLQPREQWLRLLETPSLLPAALEEVLRFHSPIQSMNRVAIEDTRLGGKTIKAGEELVGWIGSANRDEARFEQAGHFIMDRDPNPHLGFGQGIHFCLGAQLARAETQIAIRAVLERMPGLRLVQGMQPGPIEGSFVYGVKALAVEH